MDSTEGPPHITRRSFLKVLFGIGASCVLTSIEVPQPATPVHEPQATTPEPPTSPLPTPETLSQSDIELYDDLTPGIGIGVGWNGRTSVWNGIVQNIIKATASVDIASYVFVPKHLETDFKSFVEDNGLTEKQYHIVLCDPEYALEDDARETETGKAVPPQKRKGFLSSWIRDWGTSFAPSPIS